MQDLRVAIIQTEQFWENPEKNLKHFEGHLSQIKKGTVDLVLFPEMFNTSFTMNVKSMAETMNGNSIQWMKAQAIKLDCQMGATLIIEEGGNYFNRFVIVSKDGIQTQYDKRHLFRMANENQHFTAGTKRVIYEILGWKILLQVCYDLRFPVFSRNRTIEDQKEYDLLIYLANWPEKRSYVWKNLLQARAIENQVFCVGVNRVGSDGNEITYVGDSMLIDPWGKVEHHDSKNKESVNILTLKKEILKEIDLKFPAYRDAD